MDELSDAEPNQLDVVYNCSINDLPDEVLEYILSLLPPYTDLDNCKLVCKRWKKNVSNVIQHRKHKMYRSLLNFNVKWECVMPPEKFQTITKRYSHSACYHDNFMYVFGGCTCTSTTFNDLWKLDLSTRQWCRLLTMGTYPSPKACATLLYHEGSLVLFGGWTHPSPYPLHQAWKTFSELHIYDIETNCWCSVATPMNTPPPMAGHSASVHKDEMIVFGGLNGLSGSSNEVWSFNLLMHTWRKPVVAGIKPQPRYGQSQIFLDDDHLLILGGCGGGNMNLSDIWLLSMTDSAWTWRQVSVRNSQWAASHLWCHPACRVDQFVVVFSRNPGSVSPMYTYSQWRPQVHSASQSSIPDRDPTVPVAVRRASESLVEPPVVDRDVNINGRRGNLSARTTQQQSESIPSIQENKISTSVSNSDTLSSNESNVFNEEPSGSRVVTPSSVSLSKNNDILKDRSCDSTSNQVFSAMKPCDINSESSCSRPSVKNVGGVNERGSLDTDKYSNNLALHKRRLENLGRHLLSLSGSGLAAFKDNSCVKHISRQRERQLEALRRVEERIRSKNADPPRQPVPHSVPSSSSNDRISGSNFPNVQGKESSQSTAKNLTPKMAMFVLDISTVLTEECFATWLPVKLVTEESPDDMILYSLVAGNAELIMFGGIQKDAMSINQQAQSSINISNIVSNSLYFITPPSAII